MLAKHQSSLLTNSKKVDCQFGFHIGLQNGLSLFVPANFNRALVFHFFQSDMALGSKSSQIGISACRDDNFVGIPAFLSLLTRDRRSLFGVFYGDYLFTLDAL